MFEVLKFLKDFTHSFVCYKGRVAVIIMIHTSEIHFLPQFETRPPTHAHTHTDTLSLSHCIYNQLTSEILSFWMAA